MHKNIFVCPHQYVYMCVVCAHTKVHLCCIYMHALSCK